MARGAAAAARAFLEGYTRELRGFRVNDASLGIPRLMADKTFKRGDPVEWSSSQGTIEGTVQKKLTKAADIKGHHAVASPASPEYLVKSDKTGAQAAHKPKALKKKSP
jgi:hypothetical protein